MEVRIEEGWKQALGAEFEKPYFKTLADFVRGEYASTVVYPHARDIFRAFDLSSFSKTRVVILGQDPYHEPGEANGLCFSVPEGTRIPPSLRNIYKEINQDIGHCVHCNGDLSPWASQGVLLLNATLTVRAHLAGSHQKHGWEEFTDAAVRALAINRENLVFILWGSYAQKKGELIDRNRHLVLQSVHPSPLSASRGFFGNHHFSRTNSYLAEHGFPEIVW